MRNYILLCAISLKRIFKREPVQHSMPPQIADICFVVFSDDFGGHPSSCQHLFRYLPERYPVLWVNTIGMRNPKSTLRDLQKAFSKLKRMIHGLSRRKPKRSQADPVHVFQPLMFPLLNLPLIRKVNKFLVCSSVKKRLNALHMKSPILIATAPNACDYVGHLGESRVIYYCVDNFPEWPGFEKSLVRSMEEMLIRKSDILVAASENLCHRLSQHGKEVHLLTHGVDYAFFNKMPDQEHPLLSKIPKPRVGYFGLFDERSDQRLLLEVVRRMSDVSFIITGNVETDISSLAQEKNVYFTGPISYAELPAMAKGWDMCMLPYKVNKLTDAMQPLKMKEYLATGKPVISTPIKEACRMEKYIMIAETANGWEENIRRCVRETLPVKKNQGTDSFLQKESWAGKAEQFFSLCLGIKCRF